MNGRQVIKLSRKLKELRLCSSCLSIGKLQEELLLTDGIILKNLKE